MKVEIKNLKPNPYRDMENYPINENKVQALMDSIEQTGFWDNILARKINGSVQIAYGHHRLEALKKLFKPTDEVDIPVKELNESTMLKIMANENMDDWKATPQVIDETVRVTKKFLEDNPEEVSKMNFRSSMEKGIGAVVVKTFLNWPESRVSYSLERLGMMDSGKIDKQTIKDLPTEGSARNFVKVVKKYDIPKEKQKAVIERYKEKGGGEIGMREAAIQETFAPTKAKRSIKEDQVKRIEGEFAGVDAMAEDLRDGILQLKRILKELGGTPDYWHGQNWRIRLMGTLSKTKTDIDKFLDEL